MSLEDLSVLSTQLDRIETKLDELKKRLDAWEAVLPEPGSIAGRIVARRARRAGVNLWDDNGG